MGPILLHPNPTLLKHLAQVLFEAQALDLPRHQPMLQQLSSQDPPAVFNQPKSQVTTQLFYHLIVPYVPGKKKTEKEWNKLTEDEKHDLRQMLEQHT
jgi:hypothetical protein